MTTKAAGEPDRPRDVASEEDDREENRNPIQEQALMLACQYRDRLMDMLMADLGIERPTSKQLEKRREFEHISLAECEIAEGLTKIIESHLVRRAIRQSRARAIKSAMGE